MQHSFFRPDPLSDAVDWKHANGRAYRQIVEWAREDIRHNQKPAIDLYVNLLRRPHFSQKLGLSWSDHVYKVNNNLRSSLARLIMAEHPDIEFETRSAMCDTARASLHAQQVVRRAATIVPERQGRP